MGVERVARRGMRAMKIPSPPPRHVRDAAPDHLAFRFQSGEVARSLAEFGTHLRGAPATSVWFHREHFVPWLREVLGDDPLARRVEAYASDARDAEVLRELLVDLVDARVGQLESVPRA